ncbi:MAG: signal peptidase I [Clostridia bacterium]|nr:signal peptidase I [Clostridia bacterium]
MTKRFKSILEWFFCILIAFVLSIIIKYYIGTPTVVEQSSMYPTLYEKDRLILNRFSRTIKEEPIRGTIITFEAPSIKKYTNSENIDLNNPIARYEKEPDSWWEKFTYYTLEIGKQSYIKRVIALQGEYVQIQNGKVYINGDELKEEYLIPGTETPDSVSGGIPFCDFIVPEGCVFALGDNRANSLDCREFGCIPIDKIESKVWIRFYPFNKIGKVN